jgi:2-amino-4-hydroxy-6-hydroxymethyldihydropteridine diphosphokinase
VEFDAYIAIGSNLGDRELNLLMAVAELGKIAGCRVTGLSSFYETTPVGMPADSQSFYNAVARLKVTLTPHQLLTELQRIEREKFGRKPSKSPESRRMDLDLLLFDQLQINEPDLILPHPRMSQRRFVLQPLADIAPDLVHPVLGETVATLFKQLSGDEKVTLLGG